MTISLTRRKLGALLAVAVVTSTFLAVAFVHDNPTGLTPIADINSGAVAPGENVTVKCRIMSIVMLFVGLQDQLLSLTDGQCNLSAYWSETRVEVGWVIIIRGAVYSNESLVHLEWLERVWLFVWL